ncbi:hypothetical protein MKW98_006210 [Papaver atlanticum]|uniref:BED-type domain-containing protein n=1 Tax=Papaver atlanticum TaxID=357466 RepID=A0AAD4XW62_9MAGN|nr:hypothetical protein MKW98_006210 [Papaver atlanticum]
MTQQATVEEWTISVNAKTRRVKCKLCGHECSGGINRMKNHLLQIPGDVKDYNRNNEENFCKQAEEESGQSKKAEN